MYRRLDQAAHDHDRLPARTPRRACRSDRGAAGGMTLHQAEDRTPVLR
jgi:hypothetical protein